MAKKSFVNGVGATGKAMSAGMLNWMLVVVAAAFILGAFWHDGRHA